MHWTPVVLAQVRVNDACPLLVTQKSNKRLPRCMRPRKSSSQQPVLLNPPAATPLKPVEAQQPEPAVELAPRRRTRVRATQVHLDEAADDHLTELRKRAVLADVDMTASAVLRLALSELVQHYGYDRIVAMVADDGGRIRRGRPRHIGP